MRIGLESFNTNQGCASCHAWGGAHQPWAAKAYYPLRPRGAPRRECFCPEGDRGPGSKVPHRHGGRRLRLPRLAAPPQHRADRAPISTPAWSGSLEEAVSQGDGRLAAWARTSPSQGNRRHRRPSSTPPDRRDPPRVVHPTLPGPRRNSDLRAPKSRCDPCRGSAPHGRPAPPPPRKKRAAPPGGPFCLTVWRTGQSDQLPVPPRGNRQFPLGPRFLARRSRGRSFRPWTARIPCGSRCPLAAFPSGSGQSDPLSTEFRGNVAMASSRPSRTCNHRSGLGRHEVADAHRRRDCSSVERRRTGLPAAAVMWMRFSRRDDAKARGLDLGVDRAGEVTLGGVGLDDRKGALKGHDGASSQREERPQAAPF